MSLSSSSTNQNSSERGSYLWSRNRPYLVLGRLLLDPIWFPDPPPPRRDLVCPTEEATGDERKDNGAAAIIDNDSSSDESLWSAIVGCFTPTPQSVCRDKELHLDQLLYLHRCLLASLRLELNLSTDVARLLRHLYHNHSPIYRQVGSSSRRRGRLAMLSAKQRRATGVASSTWSFPFSGNQVLENVTYAISTGDLQNILEVHQQDETIIERLIRALPHVMFGLSTRLYVPWPFYSDDAAETPTIQVILTSVKRLSDRVDRAERRSAKKTHSSEKSGRT